MYGALATIAVLLAVLFGIVSMYSLAYITVGAAIVYAILQVADTIKTTNKH